MHSPVDLEFEAEEDPFQRVDNGYDKIPRCSLPGCHSLDLCDQADCDNKGERRVLVLYTGGTIGMVRNKDNVLAPSRGVMETKLRTYPNMHDARHARQRFRGQDTAALVLPVTGVSDSRVIYTVHEYDPLLDSSNMTMDDWIRIAEDIKQGYSWFDGFVVLHGTDTMAYTASALSFMLENLGKSVIITGSQIPIFETRSDGRDNFVVALLLASLYTIPEVAVFFNHELFRGNRTTKMSTGKLSAFGSPNLPPLASVGIDIEVDYHNLFRPSSIARFTVHSALCRNVGLLRLFPSITTDTVRAFLREPTQGVVLQSYGAGNVPSNRKDLLEAFSDASRRGVIVVNCTQCSNGAVSAVYETGKSLLDAGVVPGADMTPEAALTKLAYVLAKDEWDLETKRKMVGQNLRGELTARTEVELSDHDLVAAVAHKMQMTSSHELGLLRKTLYPAMLCSAAESGSIDRINTLMSFGADVTAMDYDRRTPLHVAASEGEVDVVRHLLLHGASVHVRDRSGATPLLSAVRAQQLDCVRVLVDCGANLVMPPATLGEQLCSAAAVGRLTSLEAYRLAGADLSRADATGRTALHVAALMGNGDICRLLLAHGVDAAAEDMLGFTAAAFAGMAGNYDLQKQLQRVERSPRHLNSSDPAESGPSSSPSSRPAGDLLLDADSPYGSRRVLAESAQSAPPQPTPSSPAEVSDLPDTNHSTRD